MKKKQMCICCIMTLLMAALAACGNTEISGEAELQPSGAETYGINRTSMNNSTGTGYEISDMLPPISDDMLVISLEEAEAIMNKNANKYIDAEVEESHETGENASLVVYFSRAENIVFDENVDAVTSASINLDESNNPIGNLRILAEYISEETGAEIFSIRTVETYPTAYKDTTDLATEEKDKNARPELVSHIDDMEDYDVIYLGYPNWWGTLPMPVASFLEEYDFAGKTIIPFASHEGSGLGSGVSMIKELCPDSAVLDGFAIKGSEVNTDKAREAVAEFVAGL